MYEVRGFYGKWEAAYPPVKTKKEAEKILAEFKTACPWSRFTLKKITKKDEAMSKRGKVRREIK